MVDSVSSAERAGEFLADAVRFLGYLVILSGAYLLGYWAPVWFLGESHRETMGLIAAIALSSALGRERSEQRWQQTNERLERLAAMLTNRSNVVTINEHA